MMMYGVQSLVILLLVDCSWSVVSTFAPYRKLECLAWMVST